MTSARLNGSTLTFVNRFTYLGHIIINQKMTDDGIKKQMTKLAVSGNMLLRRFSSCWLEVVSYLGASATLSVYCNLLWLRYRVASMKCL